MLDDLVVNPKLARRLPSEVAWRCHALPLAEDDGRITVAMADPDDAEARDAVVAELGPDSCVVKGSSLIIDAQLRAIWGSEAKLRPIPKVCVSGRPPSGELWDFGQALGSLLDTQIDIANTPESARAVAIQRAPEHCDLLVCWEPDDPLIRQLLAKPTATATPEPRRSVPFAILVARQGRWPLERILLVICGEGEDTAAVDWTLRIAQPSGATVTVLAVVPPAPGMLRGLDRLEQSVASLLTEDTVLGRQMRNVARTLSRWDLEGNLRLRQGAPDLEICREMVEGDHDLVVIATQPCWWWLRQLKGDPVCTLLKQIDRPMLVTEPAY
jgi:hypothetical protein